MANPNHLELARKGKDEWNSWRKSHPSVHADFSGTDFTDSQNLCINFSGFDFGDKADFSDTIFGDTPEHARYGKDPNLGTPNGAALFSGSVFGTNANFTRAIFGNYSRFDSAQFDKGADFKDATFGVATCFSFSVFGSATFYHARVNGHSNFECTLFIGDTCFDEMVFGGQVSFKGASFKSANFKYTNFGYAFSFENALFTDVVRFDHSGFGPNACFKGTAFMALASFDRVDFKDFGTFEAVDKREFYAASEEAARSLPPSHSKLYLERAKNADSSSFHDIRFREAQFRTNRSAPRKPSFRSILRAPRALFYRPAPAKGYFYSGFQFRGRKLCGFTDFTRTRFEQPPNFSDLGQAENLDMTGATFSFQAYGWPCWRNWTTQTDVLTRLRRLRKLAVDIHAADMERDIFALERMAERGIAWSDWRAKVAEPWDFHKRLREFRAIEKKPEIERRGFKWLAGMIASLWLAIRHIGRPLILTTLVFLYRVLSNFGRSVVLPSLWLAFSFVGFFFWYGAFAVGTLSSQKIKLLMVFTLSNAIPFVGSSKKAFSDSAAVLFKTVPPELHIVSHIHGLVSAVLIFLILLALRNHFRIR